MIVAVSLCVEWKFIKICVKRYCQCNFRGSEYLCKLGKEYLNTLLCKFYNFSRQNLQTFDISHAFLSLTIAKLSTLKNGPFFGPPCIRRRNMSMKSLQGRRTTGSRDECRTPPDAAENSALSITRNQTKNSLIKELKEEKRWTWIQHHNKHSIIINIHTDGLVV